MTLSVLEWKRIRGNGGEGFDVIYGDLGKDYLSGQEGHDVIYGDSDNDYITGGEGDDKLYGGLERKGFN